LRFVWGGQNSVYNALKKDNNYVIYTFDVTSPTRKKHLVIDLAQENIVNVFNKKIKSGEIKKPDIIISSTLCQSFSSITSMRKDENGNKGTSG
jgi:site-specific DNA-cytosine methylase